MEPSRRLRLHIRVIDMISEIHVIGLIPADVKWVTLVVDDPSNTTRFSIHTARDSTEMGKMMYMFGHTYSIGRSCSTESGEYGSTK